MSRSDDNPLDDQIDDLNRRLASVRVARALRRIAESDRDGALADLNQAALHLGGRQLEESDHGVVVGPETQGYRVVARYGDPAGDRFVRVYPLDETGRGHAIASANDLAGSPGLRDELDADYVVDNPDFDVAVQECRLQVRDVLFVPSRDHEGRPIDRAE